MAGEQLRSLLARYHPEDEREAGFVQRMLALLDAREPFSRRSFQPGHFTASGFVVSPDRSSLLLIFHRKLGLWLQPGGHIDATDASVQDAARREVEEEVGLSGLEPVDPASPIFDVDIHSIPARGDELAHEHFDVRFAFVAASWALAPNAEVREARWVELDAIESVTPDRSVIRGAEKLRKLRGHG